MSIFFCFCFVVAFSVSQFNEILVKIVSKVNCKKELIKNGK